RRSAGSRPFSTTTRFRRARQRNEEIFREAAHPYCPLTTPPGSGCVAEATRHDGARQMKHRSSCLLRCLQLIPPYLTWLTRVAVLDKRTQNAPSRIAPTKTNAAHTARMLRFKA